MLVRGPLTAAIQSLLRNQFVPVVTRTAAPYSGALSDGVTQGGTFRLSHQLLASVHGLRLVYGNFYNNGSGVETDGPNDITIAAAIDDNSAVYPVTFNGGQRQVTIKPGCLAYSDSLGCNFAKGATIYSRTWVSVAAAAIFPRSSDAVRTASFPNEGHNYTASGAAGADLTPAGSANTGIAGTNNGARGFAPAAILGKLTTPGAPTPAALIVGDSIAAGSSDADLGYVVRAFGLTHPFQRVAFPNDNVTQWKAITSRRRRAALAELATFSAIVCQLGVNSISSGTVQTDLLSVWNYLASFGVPVYQTTITPKTTSTDAWATTANQTVTANEAARVALNGYIRSTPAPLAGFLEIADLAETGRNSGIWRVDLGQPTTDGLHPNPAVAQVLAGGINVANLLGAAPA